MDVPECVWNISFVFGCRIDDYWDKKCEPLGQVVCPSYRQLPFTPEIALYSRFRVCRDDRQEQPTVLDLLLDQPISSVPAAKLALVKPDFDASGAQGIAQVLRRLGVLGRIA